MKTNEVILVNMKDEPTGTMEKMEAHRQGLLHRAFSVFIFDKNGRMLLQQRAAAKYHGGLLWSNACCSHPYPGESVEAAAQRRLNEELGFTTDLEKLFEFTYRADVENNLVEHEYDHVFTGIYEGPVLPNPHEVADVCYREVDDIRDELHRHPERFTSWFRMVMERMSDER